MTAKRQRTLFHRAAPLALGFCLGGAALPSLASDPPGAPMPGLGAGAGAPGAKGSGAPGAKGSAGSSTPGVRLTMMNGVIAELEVKRADCYKKLCAAKQWESLARDRDAEGLAANQKEVQQLTDALAALDANLKKARKVVLDLVYGGVEPAPVPGAKEERKEAKAGSAALPRHPFFAPSDRLAPGQRLKFATAWGHGPAGVSRPEKLVRGGDGNLYWLNRAGTAVGVLRPGGRAEQLRVLDSQVEPGTRLLDLAADRDDVLWILARCPKQGLVLKGLRGGRGFAQFRLPEYAQEPVIGLVRNPDDRVYGPWIVTRNWVLVVVLGSTPESGVWKGFQLEGKGLGAGTRLLVWGLELSFLTPGDGLVGRLSPAAPGIFKPVGSAQAGLAPTAFAFAEGKPDIQGDLYVTYAGADTIIRFAPGTRKPLRTFELAKGTGPSAITAGPRGHMVFATASGFGLISPEGKVLRLPHEGPPVAATQLVPGPAAGKLYFLEAGQPYLQALVLPWEAAAGAAPWAPGPSLLAGDAPEALPEPAEELKQEKPKAGSRAAAGAAAGAGAGLGAAVDASAGAAAAEPADSDPGDAGGEAPATAGMVLPLEPDRPAAAAKPAGAVRLVHAQIPAERMEHIFEEHEFIADADLDGARRSKGQFLPVSPRRLKQLLVDGANGDNVDSHYEGEDDTVLEFDAGEPVGRVRLRGSGAWAPTSRVRLILRRDWDRVHDRERVYLASAYPVPERRGAGRGAGAAH